MRKTLIALALQVTLLFGAESASHVWKRGMTFSHYLDKHNISRTLLNNISKEDSTFLSDIPRGSKYFEIKDDKGGLVQSLIPINEEMQIRLSRTSEGYGFDITPIQHSKTEKYATVKIMNNPYTDTLAAVGDEEVAKRVSQALKGNIGENKFHKGDKLSFYYIQKERFGENFGTPDVKVVKYSSRNRDTFIFADEDGDGHLEKGENRMFDKKGDFLRMVPFKDRTKRLGMPLRHVRITSHFTLRRFHPILKRYRPHHGTDFGARRGTPLLSIYGGKVTFAGRLGGYGKVVKIKHPMGFESLYAHQSRIKVKKGQRVEKGQIIGYVGSTGRSTGPHLHFGLKKNNKWVNPMKYLSKKSMEKKQKFHTIKMADAKKYKDKLEKAIAKHPYPESKVATLQR